MGLLETGQRLFGSLTQQKYDIDGEILKRQMELKKLAARVAVKTCNGWDDLRAELMRAADESSKMILRLSIDPKENHNLIIAEGAKRERDMELIRDIDNSESLYAALISEIETLTITKAAVSSKQGRGWGLVR